MATTTNYGWTTPDDTSLVKDGASAIRSLGTAIDTSLNTALGTKKAGLVLLNTTTLSAVSSSQINSLFSSTYRNYLIVMSWTQTTGSTYLRLSASGTPTATNYLRTGQYSTTGGSTGTWYASATGTELVIGDTAQMYMELNLFDPNIAGITGMVGFQTRSDGQNTRLGAAQNSSTQFDGIYLVTSAGTITGEVSIYGRNK